MIRQNVPDIGELVQIEVESLNYSAQAVGRSDGFVVFVSGGVPGDKVLARITQVRKNYAVGQLVDVVSESPYRCEPPCIHFTQGCGGCQWQHITYEHQLHWKKEIVRQALKRIGGLDDIPEVEARGMASPLHYRNNLRLFPAAGRGLGMRKSGSHDVVPISECLVSSPAMKPLIPMFRGEVFSAGSRLSEIGIRVSGKNQQIMLSCTYDGRDPRIRDDIDKLSQIQEVASVFYRIDSPFGRAGEFVRQYGKPAIREEIRNIKYKIGPDCFFQVNDSGLRDLVDLVRNFAKGNNRLALDAHCGVGTFALQIADLCEIIWGTDISSPAVKLAQSNAADNGIRNVDFRRGTAADVLKKELRGIEINLVILDPPRSGCEEADIQAIIRSQPEKVICISCNPTTLARDLQRLGKGGYTLAKLAMVDMFPMTYHLEVVALCIGL